MDQGLDYVNSAFTKIMPGKENSQFLAEALSVDLFREALVDRLKAIENAGDGHDWWSDAPMMLIFESLSKAGVIVLPRDPVERLRWIALLSMHAAQMEEFSFGNVLIPPDYLPDDELEEWAGLYGWGVIERVQELRGRLRSEGWDKVIGF